MIVITTPTGHIGHQLLERVLDRGEPIRVIARDPSRLPEPVRERVEVVQGSHHEPEVLAEAFADADCVFWLVPPNARAEDAEGHYLNFTRPACDAITRHGVKRVVAVSSLGRGYGRHAGLLSPAWAMDDLIEATGVDYRTLAMPYFMENLLNQIETIKGQGTFFMANTADRPLATAANRDIAATAAELVLDGAWSGQASVPVIGPDDLSPNDMAVVMSDVLERPVRFQQVPGEAYKATMMQYGMSEAWAQGLVDMAAAQNDGVYDAEQRTAHSPAPTSFRQWCDEELKPAILAGSADVDA